MQRSNTQPSYSLGGPIGKLIRYGMKKIWGVELPEKGKDLQDAIAVPPELARSGGKILYYCRLHRKELVVAIPAGIKGGQRIRLKGMGKQGKGGGEPGDLYVEIRIKKQLLQMIRGFLKGVWSSGSEGRL
jgi:curved DNA-binding protein CbpA